MIHKEDAIAENTAEAFARYHGTAASRLRYGLAQYNLSRTYDLSRPMRVLDAAGGSGINAGFLAMLGHHVTVFDSDQEMLRQAQQRLLNLGVLDRAQLVQGSLQNISTCLPTARFDLILCHHVIEYLEDLPSVLRTLRALSVPGGAFDLITLNPVSEVIRAIVFQRDPVLAESKLTDLNYDARWFGKARLYPFEDVVDEAQRSGWSMQSFRAIRALADYLGEEELDADKEQAILHLEQRLSEMDPYRRFGRYFQFSFRRGD